ncbi:hypothetical protein KM043_002227 [Ampulex compressa]|nr:hypothetical protein KM043_002227 [Ampulex compressa]
MLEDAIGCRPTFERYSRCYRTLSAPLGQDVSAAFEAFRANGHLKIMLFVLDDMLVCTYIAAHSSEELQKATEALKPKAEAARRPGSLKQMSL